MSPGPPYIKRNNTYLYIAWRQNKFHIPRILPFSFLLKVGYFPICLLKNGFNRFMWTLIMLRPLFIVELTPSTTSTT